MVAMLSIVSVDIALPVSLHSYRSFVHCSQSMVWCESIMIPCYVEYRLCRTTKRGVKKGLYRGFGKMISLCSIFVTLIVFFFFIAKRFIIILYRHIVIQIAKNIVFFFCLGLANIFI